MTTTAKFSVSSFAVDAFDSQLADLSRKAIGGAQTVRSTASPLSTKEPPTLSLSPAYCTEEDREGGTPETRPFQSFQEGPPPTASTAGPPLSFQHGPPRSLPSHLQDPDTFYRSLALEQRSFFMLNSFPGKPMQARDPGGPVYHGKAEAYAVQPSTLPHASVYTPSFPPGSPTASPKRKLAERGGRVEREGARQETRVSGRLHIALEGCLLLDMLRGSRPIGRGRGQPCSFLEVCILPGSDRLGFPEWRAKTNGASPATEAKASFPNFPNQPSPQGSSQKVHPATMRTGLQCGTGRPFFAARFAFSLSDLPLEGASLFVSLIERTFLPGGRHSLWPHHAALTNPPHRFLVLNDDCFEDVLAGWALIPLSSLDSSLLPSSSSKQGCKSQTTIRFSKDLLVRIRSADDEWGGLLGPLALGHKLWGGARAGVRGEGEGVGVDAQFQGGSLTATLEMDAEVSSAEVPTGKVVGGQGGRKAIHIRTGQKQEQKAEHRKEQKQKPESGAPAISPSSFMSSTPHASVSASASHAAVASFLYKQPFPLQSLSFPRSQLPSHQPESMRPLLPSKGDGKTNVRSPLSTVPSPSRLLPVREQEPEPSETGGVCDGTGAAVSPVKEKGKGKETASRDLPSSCPLLASAETNEPRSTKSAVPPHSTEVGGQKSCTSDGPGRENLLGTPLASASPNAPLPQTTSPTDQPVDAPVQTEFPSPSPNPNPPTASSSSPPTQTQALQPPGDANAVPASDTLVSAGAVQSTSAQEGDGKGVSSSSDTQGETGGSSACPCPPVSPKRAGKPSESAPLSVQPPPTAQSEAVAPPISAAEGVQSATIETPLPAAAAEEEEAEKQGPTEEVGPPVGASSFEDAKDEETPEGSPRGKQGDGPQVPPLSKTPNWAEEMPEGGEVEGGASPGGGSFLSFEESPQQSPPQEGSPRRSPQEDSLHPSSHQSPPHSNHARVPSNQQSDGGTMVSVSAASLLRPRRNSGIAETQQTQQTECSPLTPITPFKSTRFLANIMSLSKLREANSSIQLASIESEPSPSGENENLPRLEDYADARDLEEFERGAGDQAQALVQRPAVGDRSSQKKLKTRSGKGGSSHDQLDGSKGDQRRRAASLGSTPARSSGSMSGGSFDRDTAEREGKSWESGGSERERERQRRASLDHLLILPSRPSKAPLAPNTAPSPPFTHSGHHAFGGGTGSPLLASFESSPPALPAAPFPQNPEPIALETDVSNPASPRGAPAEAEGGGGGAGAADAFYTPDETDTEEETRIAGNREEEEEEVMVTPREGGEEGEGKTEGPSSGDFSKNSAEFFKGGEIEIERDGQTNVDGVAAGEMQSSSIGGEGEVRAESKDRHVGGSVDDAQTWKASFDGGDAFTTDASNFPGGTFATKSTSQVPPIYPSVIPFPSPHSPVSAPAQPAPVPRLRTSDATPDFGGGMPKSSSSFSFGEKEGEFPSDPFQQKVEPAPPAFAFDASSAGQFDFPVPPGGGADPFSQPPAGPSSPSHDFAFGASGSSFQFPSADFDDNFDASPRRPNRKKKDTEKKKKEKKPEGIPPRETTPPPAPPNENATPAGPTVTPQSHSSQPPNADPFADPPTTSLFSEPISPAALPRGPTTDPDSPLSRAHPSSHPVSPSKDTHTANGLSQQKEDPNEEGPPEAALFSQTQNANDSNPFASPLSIPLSPLASSSGPLQKDLTGGSGPGTPLRIISAGRSRTQSEGDGADRPEKGGWRVTVRVLPSKKKDRKGTGGPQAASFSGNGNGRCVEVSISSLEDLASGQERQPDERLDDGLGANLHTVREGAQTRRALTTSQKRYVAVQGSGAAWEEILVFTLPKATVEKLRSRLQMRQQQKRQGEAQTDGEGEGRPTLVEVTFRLWNYKVMQPDVLLGSFNIPLPSSLLEPLEQHMQAVMEVRERGTSMETEGSGSPQGGSKSRPESGGRGGRPAVSPLDVWRSSESLGTHWFVTPPGSVADEHSVGGDDAAFMSVSDGVSAPSSAVGSRPVSAGNARQGGESVTPLGSQPNFGGSWEAVPGGTRSALEAEVIVERF
uniref:C2 domain-containing protein n=1 Tax=Chromera velia CCMP2878 TaxID=1169474 RepID=A0A0G4HE63_9ALVE|eukprot:Cvel_6460.t1-p1 / transcript=Cvel_6460.t1 / gene=Cvel_6460 / organism=Chromera_velia_CCMP2878 / gene_product=hypothetical protein / transcript_product=hypothetical protein / location=Cvel_scaffold316:68221-75830(-) / protein_length=2039 / sequence_SO=supercontig / SO=protein_coding / is_pseudo=false